ncbi:hypothetical protein D3C85_961420 [compost metagenome]
MRALHVDSERQCGGFDLVAELRQGLRQQGGDVDFFPVKLGSSAGHFRCLEEIFDEHLETLRFPIEHLEIVCGLVSGQAFFFKQIHIIDNGR